MSSARLTALNRSALFLFFFLSVAPVFIDKAVAQENSPYSRYGLGDMAPNTNIVNRAMGGITAAYNDFLSINFNNPASYSGFRVYSEERTKQVQAGTVLLDVGINYDSRTFKSPNQPEKFTASNLFFSYLQLGIPVRRNWGLSFGLRPLSRIEYKIIRRERLFDPITGNPIDSSFTEFSGNGGSYLPSIGTGFAVKNFSVGVNIGYLFGKKEHSTRRALVSDTIFYNNSNHTTRSSFGDLFINAGAQYRMILDSGNKKVTYLRLGLSGNLKKELNGTQDIIRETFIRDPEAGDFQLDSVFEQTDVPGKITYPATYTAGFVVEHLSPTSTSWLFGADYIRNNWNDFRFFGAPDSVQDNWQIRAGAQLRPKPTRNYFSNVAYRAGFLVGPDYIRVNEKLPQFGISFGLGLPLPHYNRQAQDQFTVLNLALEYLRRGNNENLLKEDLFRVSLGLNFSDIWFRKRKYD